MRSLDKGWVKATKSEPCPVCGRDSCIQSPDGHVAMCWRVSEGSYKIAESGAFLHRLVEGDSTSEWTPPDRATERTPLPPPPDWTSRAIEAAARTNQVELIRFAKSLDLPSSALRRQIVSYSTVHNAWAWPMWRLVGGAMRVVGVRLRDRNGKKWSVRGGRGGLFMPRDFMESRKSAEFVVVCEGATDAAAALGMGFMAIGLPSAGSCLDHAEAACRGLPAIIIADGDDAGMRSAERLSDRVGGVVIQPPSGSDLRSWAKGRGGAALARHILASARVLHGDRGGCAV